MISKATITPVFNVHQWVRTKLNSDWMIFQDRALQLGRRMQAYMIGYIASHKKRAQSPHLDGTLPLEKSIKFHLLATAPAMISWGIGHIPTLQAQSPHWYVINYGKTISGGRFIPARGKGVPGYFQPSGRPMANKRNSREAFIYSPGTFMMYPKNPIRPINYIESTRFKLDAEFRRILPKSLMPGQLRGTIGMGGAEPGGVWR